MEFDESSKIIYGGQRTCKVPWSIGFGELAVNQLKSYGDKIAMIDGITENSVTYAEILEEVQSISSFFNDFGLKHGDIVGLAASNRVNYWCPGFAALVNGLIIAPINYGFKSDEMRHALSLTKPSIVFCNKDNQEVISDLTEKLPFLQILVVFDQKPLLPMLINGLQVYSYEYLKQKYAGASLQVHRGDPHDIAAIYQSSGTTGLPKGVMLTHRNLVAYFEQFLSIRDIPHLQKNTQLLFLPMFHIFGTIFAICMICAGIKFIIIPGFKERRIYELIEKYRVERLTAVPPILVVMSKSPITSNYDLSCLKSVHVGAAPLTASMEENLKTNLGTNLEITQGYGLTETTGGVIGFIKGDTTKPGTIGHTLPEHFIKVIDPVTGESLGPFQEGEICVKGDTVMKGYYNNKEATSLTIDEYGWLHSGDIGYFDNDLLFFIVDRLKELIKYKGFQVAPAELEGVLLKHEGIRDAGVIGIPDKLCGELPKAFVVKKPGINLTEEHVIKFVEGKVSHYKQLHGGVDFVQEIPKNASGKILRRKLRELQTLKSRL